MKKRRRGFSIVEVMVASALLGIGVVAAVRLFSSSYDGVTWTKARSNATNIAVQRLELLGTQGLASLPACAGAVGCKSGFNEYAPELGSAGTYACTRYLPGMSNDPNASVAGAKYRVDTVVEQHPDPARQPGAMLVTVSVCWSDDKQVHQAQLNRLFIPNVDE